MTIVFITAASFDYFWNRLSNETNRHNNKYGETDTTIYQYLPIPILLACSDTDTEYRYRYQELYDDNGR